MNVSTVANPARPSKFLIHVGHPGPRIDVAAHLRRALVRNELLLNVAATPRPAIARAR